MKRLELYKFDISRNDEIMEGWPDLIRTKTGKLICVYNECVSHMNRDHSKIALRESLDGGKTWSKARYVDCETFHGDHWNSIRINQLSDGRIILVCDRIHEHEQNEKTEIWMWTSTDDGATWSKGNKSGIYGFCSDKIRELSDKTLLLLVSSYQADVGRSVIYAHRSEDGGKTWSGRISVADDARYTLIEPAVLQTADGTLIAFIREQSGKNYDCMRSISKDGGKTWDGVYPIAIPCCHRPAVGYLSDGRILLTYREFINNERRVIAGALFDEATALDKEYLPRKVALFGLDYDTAEGWADGGYTAWTELENKKIIMANYITNDAPSTYIRGYLFSIDELS